MLSRKVRRLLQWLRRKYPAQTPVVVRTCRTLTDCHGICLIGDGRALIRLAEKDPEQVQCDTLMEEWAHLLRSDSPIKCTDDHDQIFWGILAQITKEWRGD